MRYSYVRLRKYFKEFKNLLYLRKKKKMYFKFCYLYLLFFLFFIYNKFLISYYNKSKLWFSLDLFNLYFSFKYNFIGSEIKILIFFNLKRGLFFYLFVNSISLFFSNIVSNYFIYYSLINYSRFSTKIYKNFIGFFSFIYLEFFTCYNTLLSSKLFIYNNLNRIKFLSSKTNP